MEAETGKIKAEYQQKLKEEVDAMAVEKLVGTAFDLSEAQLGQVSSSKKTVNDIIYQNLKNFLDLRPGTIENIRAKHRKDMKAAADRAESAKTQAVFLAEKKSALKIQIAETQSAAAIAKLEVLEKMA